MGKACCSGAVEDMMHSGRPQTLMPCKDDCCAQE